ncbi:MAG: AAA family ATPase [Bifidobacteriaceae bacterium]|jgi:energy-coupling factor transporter ATP-binding protein EcfA2|nr:AAA family ATPase [Bifidobacteriaceae bacterium]
MTNGADDFSVIPAAAGQPRTEPTRFLTRAESGQKTSGRFDARARSVPLWLRSIHAGLSAAALFVIHGSIRDIHLIDPELTDRAGVTVDTLTAIGRVLEANGFDGLLLYDPLDGLRLIPLSQRLGPERIAQQFADSLGAAVESVDCADYANLDRVCDWVTRARQPRSETDARLALVLDHTSQRSDSTRPGGDLQRVMLASLKAANQSHEPGRSFFHAGYRQSSLKHPVFWLVDKTSDLPPWMSVGDSVRQVAIPLPDLDARWRLANALVAAQPDAAGNPDQAKQLVERLVAATEGLTLKGMMEIVQFARAAGGLGQGVEEAARTYRLGVSENPWQGEALRERIAAGEAILERRVKGQTRAVRRALDLVKRSALGLTGAHQARPGGAPRGVMVMAGPTGVGKTELAKALAELVFGDERAMIRFDMSEFSQEGSDSRLIGAPPGYVGHGAGGELVNAVKRRPFTVVLFDEMEKAHPRVFDKFLQILSDGRLTSGTGETVSFAETMIVFTSNVGAAEAAAVGLLGDDSEESIAAYEDLVREAMDRFFRLPRSQGGLGRPELRGRIGDNIVVFRPISGAIARELAERFIDNALTRVAVECGLPVWITDEANAKAVAAMTAPEHLSAGGRGIALALEPVLVNPLARAIFAASPSAGGLTVLDIARTEDGGYDVVLG